MEVSWRFNGDLMDVLSVFFGCLLIVWVLLSRKVRRERLRELWVCSLQKMGSQLKLQIEFPNHKMGGLFNGYLVQ